MENCGTGALGCETSPRLFSLFRISPSLHLDFCSMSSLIHQFLPPSRLWLFLHEKRSGTTRHQNSGSSVPIFNTLTIVRSWQCLFRHCKSNNPDQIPIATFWASQRHHPPRLLHLDAFSRKLRHESQPSLTIRSSPSKSNRNPKFFPRNQDSK